MKEQQDVRQLSPAEMADAEVYTIKSSQKNISSRNMKLFKEEAMFQKVVNLQVFLLNIQFSDGLIRCNV